MSEPTPDEIEAGTVVLNNEGGLPGHSLHSWRCEDKDRYPEPCNCTFEAVGAVLDVVLPLHRKRVYLEAASELRAGGAVAPDWDAYAAQWLLAKGGE